MVESMKREIQKTPTYLINKDGQPNFGTFESSFKNFNLINYKSDTAVRRFYNKYRLTEWEAVEVLTEKGAFLTVVYRFGLMNINLTTFYDKEHDKLYEWNHTDLFVNRSKVAKNLFDGNISIYETKSAKTKITNHYENKQANVEGYSKNKVSGLITFDFSLKKISKPSVVSIPLRKMHPIYTEKDLFQFTGSIKINGVEMTDAKSLAIIDDHRAYYPRKSGYDWLTTFNYKDNQAFGLNITDFFDNQNQEVFNENGYWDKNGFHHLPNAHFTKIGDKKHITDDFGMIDLTYETLKTHKVSLNALFMKIDYKLNFGILNGYIKTASGDAIEFHDDLSLSEYRYTAI